MTEGLLQFYKAKEGKLLDVLIAATEQYFDVQQYVVLLFHEMKVMANLVLDKTTGDLIGFKDLGDPDLNFAVQEKVDAVLSAALAFFVCSICTELKFGLAHCNFRYYCCSTDAHILGGSLYS